MKLFPVLHSTFPHCRESATPERVRDRHRKLLMLNHPDTGGSTFVASKINEAKDVLLKGRASS